MRIALFVKLALVAFVVVLAFDGINIGRTAFGADNEAVSAAQVAAASFDETKNVQKAYDAAVAQLREGDTIDPDSFSFDPNGTVTLTVQRKADTVVLWRVHEAWTELSLEARSARPS